MASTVDSFYNTLWSNLSPHQQLQGCVSYNNDFQLKQLISQNVDLNMPLLIQNGNRALHIAAKYNSVKCMKLLLAHGADPDLSNDFGFLSIHCALDRGHVECLVALLFQPGCRMHDVSLFWTATRIADWNDYKWKLFKPEVVTALLLATPSVAQISECVQEALLNDLYFLAQEQQVVIYLSAGNHMPLQQLKGLANKSTEALKAWLECFQDALSLQHYARVAIRRLLPTNNVLTAAVRLPIPIKMIKYVLLADEMTSAWYMDSLDNAISNHIGSAEDKLTANAQDVSESVQ